MGRKQFDAMGKPLREAHEHRGIAQSRLVANGAIVVRTIDEAIEYARAAGDDEAMVIGGARDLRAGAAAGPTGCTSR